jgi:hypothetical protein
VHPIIAAAIAAEIVADRAHAVPDARPSHRSPLAAVRSRIARRRAAAPAALAARHATMRAGR